MTETESPTYLTPKQFCEMFNLPDQTPAHWRCQKKGPPYVKLGKHVRYELSAVRDWLSKNTKNMKAAQ